MDRELTVRDIINTMTQAQKNTLYYHLGMVLYEKIEYNPPYADINSFNDNQMKVFRYLIGCALEKELDLDTLEIVKGDK